MKETEHKPTREGIKIVNLKKRKFKEAASLSITFHKIDQLMDKKEEPKTISNLWYIMLNDNK